MRVTYIDLLGEKHPMCFSLAASEELNDVFGGLENMGKELSGSDIGKLAKAVDVALTVLMKAGRIYDEARGVELPPKLKCRPADLIDVSDPEAINKIFAVLSNDTKRDVEVQTKNAETTQGK